MMTRSRFARRVCALALLLAPVVVQAQAMRPPSLPDIDAPELAVPGPFAVGVMRKIIALHDAPNAVASLAAGHEVRGDRVLPLRIWYPATAPAGASPVTYSAHLTGEQGQPDAAFTVPGIAYADAPAAGSHYPLIVLSHGWNNDPVMLSWLGENLATKGYVVVAPEHRDPPIWDRSKGPSGLVQRPIDIVGCLSALRAGMLGSLIDLDRIGLVGYSYGGYGVLQVAGGRLDPHAPALAALPADVVAAYAGQGPQAAALNAAGIRAVVAIAPAGGTPWSVWGADGAGLAGLHAPLLVIAGGIDRTVGTAGPAAIFAAATHADRHMLVFVGAGHDIGTNPPPPEMRARLWDFDWFADPVWRKDRINAIATHMITAFLDWRVKGDATRAAWLTVPSEHSDGAGWIAGETPGYAAMSQGGANPTWKGFWRGHQDGLILTHQPAN